MLLGVDLGASTTDFVLFEKGKVLRKKSIEAVPLSGIEKEILALKWPLFKVKRFCMTGGKSASAKKALLGKPVKRIGEISAIGAGGLFVSGKKSALVVSLGTGTCIVNALGKKKFEHCSGTGVGGGTLLGLSVQSLGTKELKEINALAEKGNLSKVDLLVEDIVGKGIGKLPGSATAANFAKCKKAGKNDVALGIINMVAETNAVLVLLAAEKCGQKEIVLTGKLLAVPVFRQRLLAAFKVLGKKALVPKDYGVATAVGACVSAQTI
jgi:type II pantothenate kinase